VIGDSAIDTMFPEKPSNLRALNYDNIPDYDVKRLDQLIEKWKDEPTPANRSALWKAIMESNEWHRRMGWKTGQENLIDGMKQHVEEKP